MQCRRNPAIPVSSVRNHPQLAEGSSSFESVPTRENHERTTASVFQMSSKMEGGQDATFSHVQEQTLSRCLIKLLVPPTPQTKWPATVFRMCTVR